MKKASPVFNYKLHKFTNNERTNKKGVGSLFLFLSFCDYSNTCIDDVFVSSSEMAFYISTCKKS